EKLTAHLQSAGIPVWYDYELASGDRFQHVIRDRIDSCAALVVVMTPEADESVWVEREINHAEGRGKPVIPLLLRGEVFFRLNNVQFAAVTGERMPPDGSLARLRAVVAVRSAQPGADPVGHLASGGGTSLTGGDRSDECATLRVECEQLMAVAAEMAA